MRLLCHLGIHKRVEHNCVRCGRVRHDWSRWVEDGWGARRHCLICGEKDAVPDWID